MSDTAKAEGNEAPGGEPDVSTIAGKIAVAEKLKQDGNAYFKAKEYKKAIKKYKTIFAYVNGLTEPGNEYAQYSPLVLKEDEAEVVKAMKVSTYSNLAAAYLLLEIPGKALAACDKGQALDENHIKLLYRRSQALLGLKDYGKAKECILKGIELEPKNKSFRVVLEQFKKEYAEWKKDQNSKQKDLFAGKF